MYYGSKVEEKKESGCNLHYTLQKNVIEGKVIMYQ